LRRYARLERELLPLLAKSRGTVFLKETVERLLAAGVPDARWTPQGRTALLGNQKFHPQNPHRPGHPRLPDRLPRSTGGTGAADAGRHQLAGWIAGYLAQKREKHDADAAKAGSDLLEFSLLELKAAFEGGRAALRIRPNRRSNSAEYERPCCTSTRLRPSSSKAAS
jgi:hypothetical protein